MIDNLHKNFCPNCGHARIIPYRMFAFTMSLLFGCGGSILGIVLAFIFLPFGLILWMGALITAMLYLINAAMPNSIHQFSRVCLKCFKVIDG